MGNPAWWFAFAAVIAVLGIMVVFKQLIGEMEAKLEKQETVTQESFQTYISRFFMKVAIIEAVPIILTIVGFMQLEAYSETDIAAVMLPLVIVAIIWVFGIVNILLTRGRILSIRDIPEQSKKFLQSVLFIGVALMSSFPIISVVAILTMTA